MSDAVPATAEQETVLQEANRLIYGDRRAEYGEVRQSFEDVAAGWAIIFRNGVTPEGVALAMTWLKTCRELHAHKRDNLVDLAGYAGLAHQVAEAK